LDIKKATINDIDKIIIFVRNIYDEFLSHYHTKQGNNEFYMFIEYDEILYRINRAEGEIFFTADNDNAIIGLIEIRYHSHIALLYVEKKYHRQGIAKKLFSFIKEKNDIKKCSVNSSMYAIDIYKKMGFIPSGKYFVEKNGLKYLPMIYIKDITDRK